MNNDTVIGVLLAVLLAAIAFIVLTQRDVVFGQFERSIQLGTAALGFAVAAIGAVSGARAATGATLGIQEAGASGALVTAGAVLVFASAF